MLESVSHWSQIEKVRWLMSRPSAKRTPPRGETAICAQVLDMSQSDNQSDTCVKSSANGLSQEANMKTKLIILLLLFAMLVMSCKSDSTPQYTPETSEPTIITFAVFYEQAAYLEFAKQFEKENPDISIKIVSLYDRLGSRFDLYDYPRQVAQIADTVYEQVPAQFQGQELFLDLKPFIESEPNFDQEDFFPGALVTDAAGRITRLPGPLHLWGILYDKDLLEAAGVPYPQPGWSWDELLQMAQRLSSPPSENQDEQLYGFLPLQRHTKYWLLAQGEDLIQEGDIVTLDPPPRINLTNSRMVAALEWYANLFLVHQVAPHWHDLGFSAYWEAERDLVDAHKAVMWGGKSSDLDDLRLSSRHLGFVSYPQSVGANRYFEYQGYMISAGTQHSQEAWRWISWLSKQDIPLLGFDYSLNALPPRRSVAEAGNAWERLSPDVAAAFRWVFDNVNDFSPPLEDLLAEDTFASYVQKGMEFGRFSLTGNP